MQFRVRIGGSGIYVPSQRVTAEDLDTRLGLEPGAALARNGVAVRYFAGENETASFMGSEAIRQALASAGRPAESLDAVLFTGVMSEQPMPNTAVLIHQRLGLKAQGMTCLDINASCAGFMKAFEMAAAGITGGLWRTVAVVSVELSSKGLRWQDADTCTLFGDGAAAVVVEAASDDESGIVALDSVTLSQGAELCQMRAGGSRFNVRTPPAAFDDYLFAMQGRPLLRLVQEHFPAFLDRLIARSPHPIGLVIPHQASAVGLAFLRKQLAAHRLEAMEILREFGNQVSASIPFALHHAVCRGKLKRGDTALLIGTAAGVTMNGMLLRY